MTPTIETLAEKLLWPCWRGMPEGYKMRYARNIWGQFEDNIRSAAYTSSLAKFLDSLSRKLGIDIRADDVAAVNEAMDFEPRAALRILREATTAVVLVVRLKNEARKEQWREEHASEDLRIPGPDDGPDVDLAQRGPVVRNQPEAPARKVRPAGRPGGGGSGPKRKRA